MILLFNPAIYKKIVIRIKIRFVFTLLSKKCLLKLIKSSNYFDIEKLCIIFASRNENINKQRST
jgi:hypothetical protein